ncbi:chemotaxis protein CheC [Clostridia bacterium]|nr:chemotaxis protein CheC [Clostridia bacterium]
MGSEDYDKLLYENLDILKEIGNIGMGHASTALAQMLSMKVSMTVPEVEVMNVEVVAAQMAEAAATGANIGFTVGLQGDAAGSILHIINQSFALKVINFFFQSDLDAIADMDEMSISVMQEIGNITSGAYCNALAAMTGKLIDISIPTHCKDVAKAVLRTGEDGLPVTEPKLVIIKNSFLIDNKDELRSNFIFMPDASTIKMITDKLKEYYGFTT